MGGTKLLEGIARTLSSVLNPPVISACLFTSIVLTSHSQNDSKVLVWFVCVTFAALLPAGYAVFLVSRKRLTHLFEPDRSARVTPLIVSTLSCLLGAALLRVLTQESALIGLMMAYTVLGSVMIVLNLFWKVSLHAAGVWLPIAALGYLFGRVGIYFVPVALGVSWARVVIGAHTPLQVAAGGGVALCTTWGVLSLAGF